MKKLLYLGIAGATLLTSCSDDLFQGPAVNPDSDLKISLSGQIEQNYVTRADDGGFADGDVMGVYIVDYEGNNPGTLKTTGNRGDNVRHTFNESSYSWSSAFDIYWKDKHTNIDVYGYYPFASVDNVNDYSFTVSVDQANMPSDGSMGGYEKSDFLWAKVGGVAPTENIIRLPLAHKMACAKVTLVEGEGFGNGEFASLNKQVLVANTKQECSIDMATGTITPTGEVGRNSIIPSKRDNDWRAIVVPQTIAAGTTMFTISIDGLPYKFAKNEAFEYVGGKMNNFAIRVDKKNASGAYTLTLISESITPWENDLVSHDATLKEYVVIDVPEAGTLKECIAAAGKDLNKLRNLKVTGHIDERDFETMKSMEQLSAVNLKEVETEGDMIPANAFNAKESLISLVLPDKLKIIGEGAFYQCSNLSGSLTIPEGVVEIDKAAFFQCTSLSGNLSLPTTLKKLGNAEGYLPYWDGVFMGCSFTCELILPEGLEEIGMGTFYDCRNLYGSLHLPEKLKKIGAGAFNGCENLSGSLEIPQGVSVIPYDCFNGCWLGGTLKLHDGITAIGTAAFANNGFKGELNLPKNLEVISHYSFYNCDFSGTLVLPKGLRTIGDKCFAYNWRLMGTLEIPENVLSIGAGAFAHCRSLEGVIFNEALESIRADKDSGQEDAGAFQNCFGLGKVVCKGSIPAYVQPRTFDGVAKDNFVLEVPESAVAQYQTAPGWCEFKRISAHHELVCRPAVACALSTEHKQTLVIDAEGQWEVASKPDWCQLSQTSGNKKTEVTLTINALGATSGEREGDVVFRLVGKDYTHSCHVTQHGYIYGEDKYIPLQTATRGNNGGINIFIVGDGYDAAQIADGSYLKDMKEQIEHFFAIEPYATYRDYFNVTTAIALSTETGVGSLNTIRYNRFNTTFTGGVCLRCDYDEMINYTLGAPKINAGNLDQTLTIVVPNSTDYGGIAQLWEGGYAIAFCPKSDYGYPFDSRGVVQHEAGGHGFGKLGDEYIYHNAFIDFCGCTCCGHVDAINYAKSLGWYDNLELTGKMHSVGWSHLIFDPRYSDIVDIFEGGYMHTRGVFRSEQNSCMNNDIPYYSTISRESIVKRIKRYAGEEFNFEEFVANDKRAAATGTSLAAQSRSGQSTNFSAAGRLGHAPEIHKGSPLKNLKSKKAKK